MFIHFTWHLFGNCDDQNVPPQYASPCVSFSPLLSLSLSSGGGSELGRSRGHRLRLPYHRSHRACSSDTETKVNPSNTVCISYTGISPDVLCAVYAACVYATGSCFTKGWMLYRYTCCVYWMSIQTECWKRASSLCVWGVVWNDLGLDDSSPGVLPSLFPLSLFFFLSPSLSSTSLPPISLSPCLALLDITPACVLLAERQTRPGFVLCGAEVPTMVDVHVVCVGWLGDVSGSQNSSRLWQHTRTTVFPLVLRREHIIMGLCGCRRTAAPSTQPCCHFSPYLCVALLFPPSLPSLSSSEFSESPRGGAAGKER